METTAERVSDGYVLRGHKRWVTNGTIAGVAVIWAECDGAVRGFLVEAGTPGFEVRADPPKDVAEGVDVGGNSPE